MALPPHQLHLNLQPPPPPSLQLQKDQVQPSIFGNFNLFPVEGQIANNPTGQIPFFTPEPQYAASFVNALGLAPGEVGSSGWEESGAKKRLRKHEFLENNNTNSQISSIDFLQTTRSVSTGLGLSLDDRRVVGSSPVNSPLFPMVAEEIEREIQRQDSEIYQFLKVQADGLRQAIMEKMQAKQLQSLAIVEEKIVCKLREKEAEVEDMNKKNLELEEQMKQLSMEVTSWQNHAKYNENMMMALKFNLQQVHAQGRDNREGCGDSEVDDTASCCNRAAIDFNLMCRDNDGGKESMLCKVCRVNEVRMLLLPCRHLCLCKDCESKLSICPLCQSSKLIGVEIYM